MSHKACSKCGSSDAVFPYNNGDYCFSCHKKWIDKPRKSLQTKLETELPLVLQIPEDTITTGLPDKAKLWLYKYHMTQELWEKYHIGYSAAFDRVILPVYGSEWEGLVYYQARALFKTKQKYLNPSVPKRLFYSKLEQSALFIVLVEDIISAIRVGETCYAIALLGKTLPVKDLTFLAKKQIFIWLDKDAYAEAIKLQKRLTQLGCNVKIISTTNDPKCYTDAEIKNIIMETQIL